MVPINQWINFDPSRQTLAKIRLTSILSKGGRILMNFRPIEKQLMLDLEGKIQNVVYSGGGSIDLLGIMALKEEEVTDYPLEEN